MLLFLTGILIGLFIVHSTRTGESRGLRDWWEIQP
jgi:hypothetical protein